MRILILAALALCSESLSAASDTLRVLFIGNSYTYVNDLPAVVGRLAAASGDSLYCRSNAIGGYTLQQHSNDPATLNYISQGHWDFVVLQEQSQLPSFPDGQVTAQVYPYARKLDSLVHVYSPCARTTFYMTWGRKNGDADNCPGWPPVCTYRGMDSLLQLRYAIMAQNNNAWLSPVAKVWRSLRNNTPALELYQADESHPSPAGTYAAALSFYSLFFGKNPLTNSYNFSLSAADAGTIKTAAKAIVFDSLDRWRQFDPLPEASFKDSAAGSTFYFTNTSEGPVTGYEWNFNDGTPHVFLANPVHTFSGPAPHSVCLTVTNTCDTVTYCKQIGAPPLGIEEQRAGDLIRIYPNPAKDYVQVQGLKEKTDYTLYNSTGQKIGQGTLTATHNRIILSGITSGLYFLELRNNSNREVMKLWMR